LKPSTTREGADQQSQRALGGSLKQSSRRGNRGKRVVTDDSNPERGGKILAGIYGVELSKHLLAVCPEKGRLEHHRRGKEEI